MLSLTHKYWVGLFLIVGLGTWSCERSPDVAQSAAPTVPTESLFQDQVQPYYAQHFSVAYHKNYKVVRTSATLGNWDSGDDNRKKVEDVMVLVQRGTDAPPLSGELADAAVIIIPAETIATNNAATEIWIEMLSLADKQVAVGGLKTYNDSIRQVAQSGKIGQIGYFWSEPPNMEVLLDREPDILLSTISQIAFNQALDKCRSLDIPAAPVFDWAEQDYLGRAEWIKYISLFFNKEAQANALFEKIEKRTKELKKLAASSPDKPACTWGHYVDSGFWLAHANNAEAHFLKDAGVTNPAEDFSLPFSPIGEAYTNEEWLQLGNEVDHWIITGGTTTVRLPSENYLNGFKAYRQGQLYHHYKRSKPAHDAYDWFNLSIVRPDLVLADLVALFHPEVLPDHDFVFFGHFNKSQNHG